QHDAHRPLPRYADEHGAPERAQPVHPRDEPEVLLGRLPEPEPGVHDDAPHPLRLGRADRPRQALGHLLDHVLVAVLVGHRARPPARVHDDERRAVGRRRPRRAAALAQPRHVVDDVAAAGAFPALSPMPLSPLTLSGLARWPALAASILYVSTEMRAWGSRRAMASTTGTTRRTSSSAETGAAPAP